MWTMRHRFVSLLHRYTYCTVSYVTANRAVYLSLTTYTLPAQFTDTNTSALTWTRLFIWIHTYTDSLGLLVLSASWQRVKILHQGLTVCDRQHVGVGSLFTYIY